MEVFGGSDVQGEDGPGDANDLKLRTEQEQILIELGGKMACGGTYWLVVSNFDFKLHVPNLFGFLWDASTQSIDIGWVGLKSSCNHQPN